MKISDDFVERNIRGELILVPISGDENSLDSLFTFNETATTIWENLKLGKNELEIVNVLENIYNVSPETANSDISILINELSEIGAILPENSN